MVDRRPPLSVAGPEVTLICEQAVEAVDAAIKRAICDVAALPGDSAELQNDALSAVAHVAAYASVQLIARLIVAKAISPGTALMIARRDLEQRIDEQLLQLLELAQASN